MDTETELLRTQNWSELKRFYSSKAGRSWELAWVFLLRSRDQQQAIEQFSKSFRDPRYEAASFIALWKLGKKPLLRPAQFPETLRLYEAYENADYSYLFHYLEKSKENEKYLSALLAKSVEKMTERDLFIAQKFQRNSSFSYLLGHHADRRLKNHSVASKFYSEFLNDPWAKRVLDESRKQFLDGEMSRVLQNAYAQHDGVLVQRVLKSALAKLEKVSSQALSDLWRVTLSEAIEWDLKHISENIFNFPFWKRTELSPAAIRLVQDKMFSSEKDAEPASLQFWKSFFSDSKWGEIPSTLDPDSLALWQIRVELQPETLSEALLRFPNDERFLLLWSVRQREVETHNPKRWPANERESSVVRKNLERAFDRSLDKLVWFERLRKSGCSQDFYEYALSKISIPAAWVIEDLRNHFINTSHVVRGYLRDRLSVHLSEEAQLSAAQLQEALTYLTPAETQQVLLSRFVLSEIPTDILNDDYLELFWDARQKVSENVFHQWVNAALKYIQAKSASQVDSRHWKWVEFAWDHFPESLKTFGPNKKNSAHFPWQLYVEKLENFEKFDELLQILPQISDDRIKEGVLSRNFIGSSDLRALAAIQSIQTDYIRHSLLATWYENKNDFEKALINRELELSTCPIINEQMQIARTALQLYRKLDAAQSATLLKPLLKMAQFLESNGGVEPNLCRDISELAAKFFDWENAWQWTLKEWNSSSEAEKLSALDRLLEIAFQARAVEEAQRILVDCVFQRGQPNQLTYQILSALLDTKSVFKIRHLRKEFIERASEIFPLHMEVLKARASYDYRAVLLWDSFYGDDLELRAEIPSFSKKRDYSLWGLIQSSTAPELYSKFASYLNTLPYKKPADKNSKKAAKENEFFETAKRISQRLIKSFKQKSNLDIRIVEDIDTPFRFSFSPSTLEVRPEFFEQLDEEMWSALVVAALQILYDRDRGLFDEKRLAERFFQGMLLSGAPMVKLIRLWVWLAIHEQMIEPTILKTDPENVVEKLPFVNALIVFYLGSDFSSKMEDCGFVPN